MFRRKAVGRVRPVRHWSAWTIISITLALLAFGFMAYGALVIFQEGEQAQHAMQQSKTAKEVYGQGEQGQKEAKARRSFDDLYNQYIGDGATLKNLNAGIPKSAMTKLTNLAKQTGGYYTDFYVDRAKVFTLIGQTQNDYLALFTKKGVGKTFKASTKPSDVYVFNANHYNDLQTILAINADSKYPQWMTTQMQNMGDDAMKVERFIQDFGKSFTFPSNSDAWMVPHGYFPSKVDDLKGELAALVYQWSVLSYAPEIIDASLGTATMNQTMQAKVDDANQQLDAYKAQAAAKRAADAQAASDAQKAKDASQSSSDANKSNSDSNSNSNNSNNSNSSSGSSNNNSNAAAASSSSNTTTMNQDMPNFAGHNVQDAVNWAKSANVALMVAAMPNSGQSSGVILNQSKSGNTYYVQYAQ